jgi:iron complex transport system substrate-binding protein
MSVSCNQEKKLDIPRDIGTVSLELKYAEGFSISKNKSFTVLEIKNPWPKSEQSFRYALVEKDKAHTISINKEDFDAILLIPIERIVVTSTTHIPALEQLGVQESLVGFPGSDYISSKKTRELIDSGDIRELGQNEGINTEVLLDLNPELVVGYGVDGANKTFETIKNSDIPVIYNGDWVEGSALAKAEWLKFFGVLFNKEKEAVSIFDTIESNYIEAKQLAQNAKQKPTVLCGAMHKDIWYLPNGSSAEAQFLKDANVNYLWSETTGNGSLALGFESVFEKAKHADLWLSPSYYTSMEAIEKASEHYSKFDAFKNSNVYTFSNTTGKTGGVLYYELGTARPDLVLKDIIKICHPELLPEYEPYFFKPLN